MKRFLLSALTFLPLALGAQNHHFAIKDTAVHVVDTYLRMLNFDALPEDSILYLETTITSPGTTDTFLMRRWHARPQMFRIEVWDKDKITFGICSNGKDRYRQYIPKAGYWEDFSPDRFHEEHLGYDFRGPLYNWRNNASELRWKGTADYNGHPLQVVEVLRPDSYDRYYMFDPSNGLLTLILEQSTTYGDSARIAPSHIEWKVIHEYQPLGECLIPSLESFLRGTTLTILATKPRFLPRNTLIFNSDK